MISEVWKQINGYEDYLISNFGNVYSLKTDKYLKPQLNRHGYYHVALNRKILRVHRIVAENFIPNFLNLPCVDHIDQNKINNNLNNLRWVNKSMNGFNRPYQKNNKLKIKNISFDKNRNKYVFSKTINGKLHAKRFNTLDEAIKYKTLMI
tara:strand:+ start:1363 stop:1812 length:450 start_codon:yes stop_codon:yes gene_type:complete